jgi:hypothetical protein
MRERVSCVDRSCPQIGDISAGFHPSQPPRPPNPPPLGRNRPRAPRPQPPLAGHALARPLRTAPPLLTPRDRVAGWRVHHHARSHPLTPPPPVASNPFVVLGRYTPIKVEYADCMLGASDCKMHHDCTMHPLLVHRSCNDLDWIG